MCTQDCGHLLGAEDALFSPLPVADQEPAPRLPPTGDMMLVRHSSFPLAGSTRTVCGWAMRSNRNVGTPFSVWAVYYDCLTESSRMHAMAC